MAVGDVTATYVGTGAMDSAAFLALLEALNVGAATSGTKTSDIHIVPYGNNNQAAIFKLAYSAV